MIYGERIRFRAIERDDLPRFVAWFNDPEVRTGIQMHLPMSMTQEEIWYENMVKRSPETQPMIVEVKEPDGWLPIGNIGIEQHDTNARSAVFGIVIGNQNYWNKGYGTEATELMLKHCFKTLNLNRVSLQVFENNPRAVRCYEEVGFVHEGRLRQAVYREGRYWDVFVMSVLKQDWIKKQET